VVPGARTVTLLFGDGLALPPGVSLLVYAPGGPPCAPGAARGPACQVHPPAPPGAASLPVPGEEAVAALVARSRADLAAAAARVSAVIAGTGDPGGPKSDGDPRPRPWYAGVAGGCNVDVPCDAPEPWRSAKQAVVQVLANHPARGAGKCTGVLLNNPPRGALGKRQLVLTAGHCLRGADDDARYWQFLL